MFETVIVEMLQQRHYTDIKVHKEILENQDNYNSNITCIDQNGKNVYVKYMLIKHKVLHELKKYLEQFNNVDTENVRLIIVLLKKPTNSFKQKCEKYNIEIFTLAELQTNITKHYLVPLHVLITDEHTIKDIFAKYRITNRSSFPEILLSDPVCRFYGGKPGNIFKIVRISPVSGKYVSYRHVINLKK